VHLRQGRGQVLVLAALTISLAILSTQAYVYQRSRARYSTDYSILSDYVLSIEQGSRHVVVASLINVSGGGGASNLEGNLDRWEALVVGDYRFGRCDLNTTLASQLPYSDGVWLDWGTDGKGVSSAFADFTLNLSGRGVGVEWSFDVNASTVVLVSGYWAPIHTNETLVTVIIDLLNDGEPALASNVTVAYWRSNEWNDPSVLPSYSMLDYGNGTYRCSFIDVIPDTPIQVRVQASDRRGVFVQAEASLPER